jgi:hypothetical protein
MAMLRHCLLSDCHFRASVEETGVVKTPLSRSTDNVQLTFRAATGPEAIECAYGAGLQPLVHAIWVIGRIISFSHSRAQHSLLSFLEKGLSVRSTAFRQVLAPPLEKPS